MRVSLGMEAICGPTIADKFLERARLRASLLDLDIAITPASNSTLTEDCYNIVVKGGNDAALTFLEWFELVTNHGVIV